MQQVGALPYKISEEGHLEVMLVTTRRTGRWIVAKGNLIRGLKAHEAAAREAFEEAGVKGKASKRAIGTFRSQKWRAGRLPQILEVTVFPMQVTEQLADWPERAQRQRRWVSPMAAANMADEPGLRRLLQAFHRDRLEHY